MGRLFASDPEGACLCSRFLRAVSAASLSYRARDPPPSHRIPCSRSHHPYDENESEAIAWLRERANVRFDASAVDMAPIYERTSVLLVPSRWPESWPRVVGEAQTHGIPILGSDRGCIPHAVSRGGVVLSYGDPELWCAALDRVLGEKAFWTSLSHDATRSVTR
ncbi:MAG: glycosyltransferase, partial [Gemmatimonadaceae bacterium]